MSATTPTTTRSLFRAEGFSCPSCVGKIERQVGRVKGVKDVTVKFASSRIEVDHDPAIATTAQILEAIAKAGYTATPSAY